MVSNFTKKITDLRMPHDWWEKTRSLTRTFHLHMGPTNSGKTFCALEKLKTSKKGVYCGPLRLLATEIFEKLNNSGVKCSLKTGQETKIVPGATHLACTIEALNLDEEYDCALIDEIQMIENYSRGSAWTYAILGLYSPEIHLTGDPLSRKIIQSLLEKTQDKITNYTYQRLSSLKMTAPVCNIKDLMPGDCLVAFSRVKCHALKNYIEKSDPGSCSIIYGRLPPAVRIDQAEKFNSGQHKYLISTDAIGMGLNYNINRVIFTETVKKDGNFMKPLTDIEIKQIGGRAGRYKKEGFVTGTSMAKFSEICIGMNYKYKNYISQAGLTPLYEQIKEFAEFCSVKNENYAYSYILKRFKKEAKLENLYFLQSFNEACEIADILKDLKLPHDFSYLFTTASINISNRSQANKIYSFAECIKQGKDVRFEDFHDNLDALSLLELENIYSICENYNSLARKFKFEYFTDNESVIDYKIEVSKEIQYRLGLEIEKTLKINAQNGELDIF